MSTQEQIIAKQLEPLLKGLRVDIKIPSTIDATEVENLMNDLREAASCLLVNHNVRMSLYNDTISIKTKKYGSYSW
jgi:hypothetical protein